MQPLRGGGWAQGFNCQAVTSQDGLIIAVSVSNNPVDAPTFEPMMNAALAAAKLITTHQPATTEPDTTTVVAVDTAASTTDITTAATTVAAASTTGPDTTVVAVDTATETAGPDSDPAGKPLIGLFLADAGYLSDDNLTCEGPDRLIAIGKHRDLETAAATTPTSGTAPEDATPIEKMTHRLRTDEGITAYRQRSHIAETPFGHFKHNLGFRSFTGRGLTRATTEWTLNALVYNICKAFNAGHLSTA